MAAPKALSKTAWQRRNDRGPHKAYLPSGPNPDVDAPVVFVIPDLSMLARNGLMPEEMQITAELMSAHPRGPEGYSEDLVSEAIMRGGDAQATIAGAIKVARELTHHLIAEMLVEPKVTAQEVESGIFPELDMRMLVEFATRTRNVDAAGRRLPIVVPSEERWATFRFERTGSAGAGDSAGNGAASDGAPAEPDGGDV